MSWISKLPVGLRAAAYFSGEEAAWVAEEAIDVLACASEFALHLYVGVR
jgi:hypothetical protein